jgi:hypothetical protein
VGGDKRGGWEKDEMTHTLYAHMNKILKNEKKESVDLLYKRNFATFEMLLELLKCVTNTHKVSTCH